MRRLARLSAAALLVAAVSATVTAAVAPAATAAPAPLRYVALGDSYSAGAGLVPTVPGSPANCLRSTLNYPHVLAARLGASLTDVTCSGAQTKDYATAQYDGVPPQLDAVRDDTQLVTMTIGGNDGGVFSDSIIGCGTAGTQTAGQGSPCKDQNGSKFVDTITRKTYPALVTALRAVRAKASKARVAILGYPWILPATVGCYPQMPIAKGDVPYLRHEQAVLNYVVARAAAVTGSTYIDLSKASDGHDACQPIGVRWIEPVVGGTNPVVVHPNAYGEQQMALNTAAQLR